MAKKDYTFTASLEISEILKALKTIDQNVGKLVTVFDALFTNAEKGSNTAAKTLIDNAKAINESYKGIRNIKAPDIEIDAAAAEAKGAELGKRTAEGFKREMQAAYSEAFYGGGTREGFAGGLQTPPPTTPPKLPSLFDMDPEQISAELGKVRFLGQPTAPTYIPPQAITNVRGGVGDALGSPQKIGEVNQAVQESLNGFRNLEGVLKSSTQYNLQLTASQDKLTQTMLRQAAANTTTVGGYLEAVQTIPGITQAQAQLASQLAIVRTAQEGTYAQWKSSLITTEEAKDRLIVLNGALQAYDAMLEKNASTAQQAAAAQQTDKAAREAAAQAVERQNQALIQATAAELQTAAGADKTAQAFVQQAAAVAPTADALIKAADASGLFGKGQAQLAGEIALTKKGIEEQAAEIAKSGGANQEAVASYNNLVASLQQLLAIQNAEVIAAKEAAAAKKMLADANKLEEQQNKANEQNRAQAERSLVRLLRVYPNVANQIRQVVAVNGSFTASINSAGTAQSAADKKFQDAIKTDKQLAAEVDKLREKYGDFTLNVDKATLGIGKGAGGIRGFIQSLTSGEAAAAGFGAAIGTGLVGAISAAISALAELGKKAVEVFTDITKASIATANEFESTTISFRAIFNGSEEAAREAFTYVREQSRNLGVDLAVVASSFLPITENLEQLGDIARISSSLLRLPGAVAQGRTTNDAIIALNELLIAGQTRSLQTRFNIPLADTRRIKEALQAEGLQAAINELNAVLQRFGINIDDFRQTLPFLTNQIQQYGLDLRNAFGQPIKDAISPILQRVVEWLEENREKLEEFARTAGTVLGGVVTDVGELLLDKLEGLDVEKAVADFEEFIQTIGNLIISINSLSETLEPFGDLLESLSDSKEEKTFGFNLATATTPVETLTNSILEFVDTLDVGNEGVNEFIKGFLGSFTTFVSVVSNLLTGRWKEAWERAAGYLDSVDGASRKVMDGVNLLTTAIYALTQASIAFSGVGIYEVLKRAADVGLVQAVKDYGAEVVGKVTDHYFDQVGAQKDLADAIDEVNKKEEITLGLADEILRLKRQGVEAIRGRIKDLEEDEEYLKAKKKIEEAIIDLEIETKRKRRDLALEDARRRLDIEQDFAEKNFEIAKDYERKLRDLQKDRERDLDDALKDYNRDLEDEQIKAIRDEEDRQIESAKRKADIEEDYLKKIRDLRRQFELDAAEAIRQNDAIAYTRLIRKYNSELEEAKQDRQDKLNEAKQANQEQEQEDARSLKRREEDAQRAYDRELADLEESNKRKKEDIEQWYTDAQIDAKEHYDLQVLAQEEWLRRAEEDLDEALRQREQDMKRNLGDEAALIKDHNQQLIDLEKQLWAAIEEERIAGIEAVNSATQEFLNNNLGYENPNIEAKRRMYLQRVATQFPDVPDSYIRRLENARTIYELDQVWRMIQLWLTQNNEGDGNEAPGMASGGPVKRGEPYFVGEEGVELFVPDSNGKIIPNDELMSATARRFNSLQQQATLPAYSARIPTSEEYYGRIMPFPKAFQGMNMGPMNQNTVQAQITMADPNSLTPTQQAIVEETVKTMLVEVFRTLGIT